METPKEMHLLWKDGQKSRERIKKKHLFLLKMDCVPWEKKLNKVGWHLCPLRKKLNELRGEKDRAGKNWLKQLEFQASPRWASGVTFRFKLPQQQPPEYPQPQENICLCFLSLKVILIYLFFFNGYLIDAIFALIMPKTVFHIMLKSKLFLLH